MNKLPQEISAAFQALRANHGKVAAQGYRERRKKLKSMLKWIFNHNNEINEALYQDLGKPEAEANLTEQFVIVSALKHTIANFGEWMMPSEVPAPMALISTSSHVRYEPKGVVLIQSPWNYPFQLVVEPLTYAVAAGNCAILKPSEFTPHVTTLLQKMVSDLFDENEVVLFDGGTETAIELLKLPFDHIFFTGSPEIGKKVMRAAAENLTSVTLELGGKSPVVVDESANIKDAAAKIAWGKFVNCGQVCVAPDYVLVHESKYEQLLEALKNRVATQFGADEASRKASADYSKIVNQTHINRLKTMIDDAIEKGAQVECGAMVEPESRYVAPTILTGVNDEMRVMQEEIFGPILPVISFSTLDEALGSIKKRSKPLAMYIFSNKRKNRERLLNETSAGGGCINDVLLHNGHPGLPFGGVNESGIGKSHGFYGFREFSNERAILKHNSLSALKMLYPPYTGWKLKLSKLLLRYS